MSNLVLYRKYRPKTFAEVVGQQHVIQTLTNAILSGNISHAYLFSGPRGSGKTTMGRLLAKAVNCQQCQGFEPCNKCSSCLEINQGRAMDIIEIDAASNRGIDEIRNLREGIRFSPTKLKYKVFIIDESHQLSKEAANALLKTLEEPPAHAIFILATTEIHKMIPTIVSRCQSFEFRKLTIPEIVRRLKIIVRKEKATVEKAALELIALNSGGSIRDAEGLLDQALTLEATDAESLKELLGIVDVNLVAELVDFLCQKEGEKAITFLNKTLEKGKDPQEFSKALINYLRQGLILKIGSDFKNPLIIGLTPEQQQRLRTQMATFREPVIGQILKLFLEAEAKMKYSPIPQLPLELAIIEVLNIEKK